MVGIVTAILLALPLSVLSRSHQYGSSLRRRHHQLASRVIQDLDCRAATYRLIDNYDKNTFFDMFDFFSEDDPTHGLVDYVSKGEAFGRGLAAVQGDGTIMLAVDSTTQLKPGDNRKSVRVSSKKSYNAGTLFLADIKAMPTGCSLWPAYWSVGPNWPNAGEIDILEGVNGQDVNQVTLHTSDTCTKVQRTTNTTGRQLDTTCLSSGNNNNGCAFVMDDNKSHGQGFNANGGGVFAHTWDEDAINVWFFPRNAIPQDITSGKPKPSTWGAPAASFLTGSACNVAEAFHDHQIIFDITLCGDWAGATYNAQGCPGTCAQRVADPENFKDAKFNINYVKVFQHL